MSGEIRETYHAALAHDLVDLPDDATLVGVVRKPTGWFGTEVDENRPALGPPEDLLEETTAAAERIESEGVDETPAHNLAWEETEFERRYREHVASDDAAQAELADLAGRVEDGETVVLVCFEAEDKRCHRHLLCDLLAERVDEAAVAER
jgi:uncharacterized protein YeaO (DUF488 family)